MEQNFKASYYTNVLYKSWLETQAVAFNGTSMVGKQELALCFRVARSKEQKPGRKRQISKSNLKIIEHKSILSIKTAFDQVNNNYQYAEIT